MKVGVGDVGRMFITPNIVSAAKRTCRLWWPATRIEPRIGWRQSSRTDA